MVGTVLAFPVPLHQAALHKCNPEVAVLVFVYGIYGCRSVSCGCGSTGCYGSISARPQFGLQALRREKVDAAGFRTEPDGFSISEQAVDGVTIDGDVTPVAGLADKGESIRIFMVNVQAVEGRDNQMPAFCKFDVRYVSLAQHSGAMGGVSVSLQTAFGMVVFEKSAVRTNPQHVAIRLHTGNAPVFTERHQAVGKDIRFQEVAGLFLNATHLIVDTCTNGPADIKNSMYRRGRSIFQTIIGFNIPFIIQLYTPQILVTGNP